MPVSEARLAANRANAKKSTGPRTAHGKRRSAQNAVTHGLLRQSPPLSPADQHEYQTLLDDLTGQHEADTPNERLLAQHLAVTILRRAHARQAERDHLDSLVRPTRDPAEHHRRVAAALADPQAQRYARYAALRSREFHRALSVFLAARRERRLLDRHPLPPTLLTAVVAPDETNPTICPVLNEFTPSTNPIPAFPVTVATSPFSNPTNPIVASVCNEIAPKTNPPTLQECSPAVAHARGALGALRARAGRQRARVLGSAPHADSGGHSPPRAAGAGARAQASRMRYRTP